MVSNLGGLRTCHRNSLVALVRGETDIDEGRLSVCLAAS